MSLQRPTGISILAVLYGLGGVSLILFSLAIGAIFAFYEFGPPRYYFPAGFVLPPGLATIIATLLFVLGLLFIIAARALWTGKGWARNFALALQVIGILVDLGLAPYTGASTFFGIVIGLVIIYYLTRQNVKAFFTPLQPPTVSTQVPPPYMGGTSSQPRGGYPPPGVGGVQPRVFCANCGTENVSGATFCKTCGTRLLT